MLTSTYSPAYATTWTDDQLVEAFRSGNQEVFTEMYNRHHQIVYVVCLQNLKNRDDAIEITQETFMRAFKGLARFRGDSSLKTWLYKIAVNLSRNRYWYWYWYRRRRHSTLSMDATFTDTDSSLSDLVSDSSSSPDEEFRLNEMEDLVSVCMNRLPKPHKEILDLRNTQHLTYEEISQRLGIEIGTVKSRVARARKALLVEMQIVCPDLRDEVDLPSFLSIRSRNTACMLVSKSV